MTERKPGRPAGRNYDTPRTFELRARHDQTLNALAKQWGIKKSAVVRRLIEEKEQQAEVKPVAENSASAALLEEAAALEQEAAAAESYGARTAASLRSHAATLRTLAARVAVLEAERAEK